MKNIFNRIEFWIVILFLVRLIGITNPPLEIGHNWRQATGLMVARNYLEENSNILYPRIDDNNGETGIIGMEFPSMNYAHFLLSKAFGYTHWYGRLINLIVSSFGLFFFYKIIIWAGFKKSHAFISTIILAVSIWFAFSRKFMPDTYSISIMFIGLYYGLRYLEGKKWYQLLLYILISSFAVLSKIPAGIYFVVLIPFLLSPKYEIRQRFILSLITIIPVLLTCFWYFKWNYQLSNEFGTWYNSGVPLKAGFYDVLQNIGKVLDNFYFDAFSGYIIFSFFLFGIVLMFVMRNSKVIWAFVLVFTIFVIYIFKSGAYFYDQNYYIIPFVPVMAFVAGFTLSFIQRKWILISILLLGIGESIVNQQHDFFIKESEKYKMTLETIMDKVSSKNDLIVINGNGNPQTIYLSHRKGWNCSDEQLSDMIFINEITEKGCRFIVVNKHLTADINNLKEIFGTIFEDEHFVVFESNLISQHSEMFATSGI